MSADRYWPNRFQGKVAIVTGAAGGIGRATARRLALEGCRVIVADIAAGRAEETAAALRDEGLEAVAHATDVSVEAQVERMVARAVSEWGRLDIIHNNAAKISPEFFYRDKLVADLDVDVWDETMAVDLRGVMLGIKHAIPVMLNIGGGAIVNTSSEGTRHGNPLASSAYAAAKSGVEALTIYTAVQYGKQGIRCNAIVPGLTLTETVTSGLVPEPLQRAKEFAIPSPAAGTPEDQAAVVAFLASDDARYVNGQLVHTGGGSHVTGGLFQVPAYVIESSRLDAGGAGFMGSSTRP